LAAIFNAKLQHTLQNGGGAEGNSLMDIFLMDIFVQQQCGLAIGYEGNAQTRDR